MLKRLKIFALILICGIGLTSMVIVGCANPQLPLDDGGEDPIEDPAPDDPEPAPDDPDDPSPDPVLAESATLVDFQSESPGIAAMDFAGIGFFAEPDPGQLDADAFRILGFSDGDRDFGVETGDGDFARGPSDGGVSTGGLNAFAVAEGNRALGVQPTSSDFAPGVIVLRAAIPADAIEQCRVGYRLWVRNDQGRSTSWSASWSLDDETWHELADTAFTTPAAEDALPGWSAHDFAATIGRNELEQDAVPVAGEPLYLRWDARDAGGDGSRDECAIDDISIVFFYPE